MKEWVLELLACPDCHNSPLNIHPSKHEGDQIVEATLSCVKCNSSYRVREGIPMRRPEAR